MYELRLRKAGHPCLNCLPSRKGNCMNLQPANLSSTPQSPQLYLVDDPCKLLLGDSGRPDSVASVGTWGPKHHHLLTKFQNRIKTPFDLLVYTALYSSKALCCLLINIFQLQSLLSICVCLLPRFLSPHTVSAPTSSPSDTIAIYQELFLEFARCL